MKRSPIRRKGKRTKKSKGHLFPNLVDEVYRAWIRSRPCVLRNSHICRGRVDPCHVKSRGSGGGDHNNLVPMCRAGHDHQGEMGIESFQYWWEVDLVVLAQAYYREYERDYLTPFE